MFRSYNVRGSNDATYPTVAMRFSADYLELWNPSTDSIHVETAPTQDLLVAINNGPYPGYRDQAAAFSAGDSVNFFWIWGSGPGLQIISSLRSPYQGPVLPSGYDSFCHAGSMILSVAGVMNNVCILDKKHFYLGSPLVFDPTLVTDPGNNTEHFIDLSAWVPSHASEFELMIDSQLVSGNGAGASSLNRVGVISGRGLNDMVVHENLTTPAGTGLPGASEVVAPYLFPNISRGIYFDWFDFVFFNPNSVQHRWMSVYIRGYTVP